MVVRLRQIEATGYIYSMFVVHSLCVCMRLYIYNYYQEFGHVIIEANNLQDMWPVFWTPNVTDSPYIGTVLKS